MLCRAVLCRARNPLPPLCGGREGSPPTDLGMRLRFRGGGLPPTWMAFRTRGVCSSSLLRKCDRLIRILPFFFLGVLNRKLIHGSAIKFPVHEICHLLPVVVTDQVQCLGTVGPANYGFLGGWAVFADKCGGSRCGWLGHAGGSECLLHGYQGDLFYHQGNSGCWWAWGASAKLRCGVQIGPLARWEGVGVIIGGWGEASSIRCFSVFESHGHAGCSPNSMSSRRSPPSHSMERGFE